MQILDKESCVSVDAGACIRSNAYIDFYLNGNNTWATVLLRDGSRLLEHQQRFERGGTYIPILKHANKWTVIDTRRSSGMEAPKLNERKNMIYLLSMPKTLSPFS
jgi:hypothetical protein